MHRMVFKEPWAAEELLPTLPRAALRSALAPSAVVPLVAQVVKEELSSADQSNFHSIHALAARSKGSTWLNRLAT